MAVRYRWLAAQSVKNGRIVTSVSLCVRMSDGIGTLKGGSHSRDRHVDVAEDQRAHDIRARPAAPASWPAARAASLSASLLALNASKARSISFTGIDEMSHETGVSCLVRASR